MVPPHLNRAPLHKGNCPEAGIVWGSQCLLTAWGPLASIDPCLPDHAHSVMPRPAATASQRPGQNRGQDPHEYDEYYFIWAMMMAFWGSMWGQGLSLSIGQRCLYV